MRRTYRLLAFLMVLILPILACSTISPSQNGSQATNPPQTQNTVLFQDDFSDSSSGWDQIRESQGVTDYENGQYRIQVLTENTDVWANPGLNFTDVRVEADATKAGGPDDNDFGLICRYQDTNNFYFFIISSDGYGGIGKVKDGEQILIGHTDMPPSDAINQGAATNHIRADCVGSTLTLYANGTQIDQQTDSDYPTGDVGLLAGTYTETGTDILFDNFVVLKP